MTTITWTAPEGTKGGIGGKTFTNGRVISQNGETLVDFGEVKIDGNARTLKVRVSDKPELAALVAKVQQEIAQAEVDEEAKLAANVPGLEELQEALQEHEEYRRAFSRMMEDEMNDGVNPPKPTRTNLSELKARYPRAAAYLRAEDYSCAHNHAKAAAGDRAMERIVNGDDLAEVMQEMENWVPESAVWN